MTLMDMAKGRAGAIFSAAAALFLVAASSAQAKSAREIIDLHVKALGGTRALRAVASVRLSGTANGTGEFLWQTKVPDAYSLEARYGGAQTVEAFNGKSAWRTDEAGGMRTLIGREQQRARATGAYRNDHFLTYRKDKTRAHLLGRATVEGRPAYAVELTTVAGIRRKVFFDAETHLVLKEEQERDGGTEEILFSDYRAVDGVREPHRIRIRRGAETLDLVVQEATHNVGPEAAAFDFPRRDGRPLPDIAHLFGEVLDNQNRLQRAREDYTYTKTESEIRADGKGEKSSERTYEVFSAYGKRVEKLVARNGQPLRPDEAREEDERVEKAIRENKTKAEKRARESQRKAERDDGDDNDLTVAKILGVCRLVNPRREWLRGRDVLVLDFEPRPGQKPDSRLESAIQKMAGNVWVDEEAKRLVRLEAHVKEPIKIAGGLVLSVQRGSFFVFEQELVNGEVWLPSYAEVNALARFLLLKGYEIHQTQRFSDYKKFDVETSWEVKAPGQ